MSEKEFIEKHDEQVTWEKLRYALITNRPLSRGLVEAIAAAAEGRIPSSADALAQYNAFYDVVGSSGLPLQRFATRLQLIGSTGELDQIERGNAAFIADWSASNDIIARARLGDLRELVRKKAGSAGQWNKIISKVDVLAALGLAEESNLLPTPQAFPETGKVVERVQLADFITKLGASGRWLVHAAGGIGKTVFAQGLAGRLASTDEVVLFDCFGGGAYRSPIDGRHRPERGLLHIVNELACRGLCDPILPNSSDPSEVIRRSIQRFGQAIEVIRRTRPSARLMVVIDAADNAAMEARNRAQPSFPSDLMEALSHLSQTEGLIVVATARTERRNLAVGRAECAEYELDPFTLAEAGAFIRERRPEATAAQIEALVRRSDGNPRVIANLIEPDRSLIGEFGIGGKVELNLLIEERIERAIKLADQKGTQSNAIAAFLCALSVLPPPVPVEDMASAFGLQKSEIESLAADLSPLLERTRHGLIFRDEPTETLVGIKYGAEFSLLNDVVTRLKDLQDKSIYAARALPGLLFAMGRTEELRELAFDARFPPGLDSEVAKRAIRLNRLKTALSAAATSRNFDAVVDLLVEMSTIALVDERGQDYLLENPDLVVALGDSESLRRLFEVRTGWPGTRHARLAIAYTTDGDTAEAYGHAVRTEEWLRWARDQDEGRPMHQTINPEIDDYVAIPYYLFAKGRFVDAANYIGRWKGWYAYKMASRLFGLCIVAQTLGKVQLPAELFAKLGCCRHAPPALIAAALSAFPTLDASTSEKLLVRLTTMLKEPEKLDDDYSHVRESDSYRSALIRCALRAANLGLAVESRMIHGAASPERYRFYVLHDPFHTEYIASWLLSVAALTVAENRDVTLADCLPIELLQLMQGSEIPQEDEAQEKLLRERLAEKPSGATATDEEKRTRLSAAERHRVPDYLRERIRPLVELARCIANVVKAKTATELDGGVGKLFDSWEAVQRQASQSVHFDRELTRFLDNLYIACSLQTLSALGQIDDGIVPRFAERLNRCMFVDVGVKIALVRQLAGIPSGHRSAGIFAVEAVGSIEQEDDVTRRSSLFGELARALLPANMSEARSLFNRGLTELDALGSGDYEFTNELLAFAASLRGGPVSSITALRLAKICELNNYDSRKFPWPLAGKAFSRAWGTRYLSQIARWHDRDRADLELTLPAALTFLIRDRHLVPEDAVPLLGLVEIVESWDWGWVDIIKSLMDVGAEISLFESVFRQYEADHPSGSYYRLKDIRAALESSPEIFAALNPTMDRLQAADAQRRKVDRSSYGGSSSDSGLAVLRDRPDSEELTGAEVGVDPLSATELEALIFKLEETEGALDAKQRAFAHLRAGVAYGDRDRHIEAIVAARNLKLFEKNVLLKEIKEAWISDSPSHLEVLRRSGAALIRNHAEELLGSNWGFNWELNKVAELSGVSRAELAISLAEAAMTRELSAAATTWMNLASILSTSADASVARRALERLMDNGAARLADEIGDGPWRNELDPGDDPTKVAAGLVWFCLGSPEAVQRWRAAHVVRDYARFGRWHIIEELFALLDSVDAGAFQDRDVPFFILHARLWFLFAVARLSLDYPEKIAAFIPALEKIVADDSFPHVAMRDAARRAIAACAEAIPDPVRTEVKAKLAMVNRSAFPKPTKRTPHDSGFSWNRPEGMQRPEPSFSFDYDFEKSDLNGLGRLFGIPQWEIEDRCVKWIRKWNMKVSSMYDFAGRRKRGDSRDYRAGTTDSYHSFGTYVAWHALALVGGELVAERPLVEVRSYEDPWDEWLLGYSITRPDGLWLADGTRKYPSYSRHDIMRDNDEGKSPSSDRTLLLSLAGIEPDLSIGERLTVSGSWNSPDSVHASIMSALVPDRQAQLAARALATSPDFHMWLPTYRYDDDDEFRHSEYGPLEAWITARDAYVRLDQYDPHGSKAALERPRPAIKIRRRFRLSSEGPWSAVWNRPRKLLSFNSDAWGGLTGEGRSENWEQGTALQADRKFLTGLLQKLDRSLLLLIKLQHYREKQRFGSDADSDGSFTHSWIVLTINKRLEVELFGPDAADMDLVATLPEHSRFSFDERLTVLSGK